MTSGRRDVRLQLVEALMQVPALDELHARRQCVQLAQPRGRPRVYVRESDDKRTHLIDMVLHFAELPDGWRLLTETVQFLAGHDLHSVRAAELVHPAAVPLFAEADRAELGTLLEGLDGTSVPELPRMFTDAAGGCAPHGADPARVLTAWEAYVLLEQCNVPPDGVPRSVLFLQEVAMAVEPARAERLRVWASRAVRRALPQGEGVRVVEAAQRAAGRSGQRDRSCTAYLLFRLRQLTDAPDQVLLTCWSATDDSWAPRKLHERLVPEGEVPRRVADLVNRQEAALRDHKGGVVLEFILPFELLNLPVEEFRRAPSFGAAVWKGVKHGAGTEGADGQAAHGDEFSVPLGFDYQVVVRSLERMEDLAMHRVWNNRWGLLADGAHGRAHRCSSGDGARRDDLSARLAGDQDVVLMTLGSPPDDVDGRAELAHGIMAGLPVLVWAHEGALSEAEHAMADRVVRDGVLESLPAEVRSLRSTRHRRDHDGQGSVMGSRVAVLWDDPQRLPEVPEFPEAG